MVFKKMKKGLIYLKWDKGGKEVKFDKRDKIR